MFNFLKSLDLSFVSSMALTLGATLLSTSALADTNSKTKYGITVTTCNFDFGYI